MSKSAIFTILTLVLLASATPASATEEYARQTGWECKVCHVNQLGGGELTPQGERFVANLISEGKFKPLSPMKRAVRLILGYLHILAGVVWFGAIFYVHILLKPAYAAKGLPKGELILGWTCIIVIGLTGGFLTYARMPSLAAFYETRFGVLLSIKIILYLVMALSAALVTFVLGPRMKRRRALAAMGGGEYTLEGLQGFDGKEGRKALAACRGYVYDLTGSSLWKDGRHMRHLAGADLTEALTKAPHGLEKFEPFPVVGRLSSAGPDKAQKNMPKAVFYIMAYMNLVLVFLILAVVALWRWW
jgi:predicted heme/steroid binding protein/uncharacterized membrane protein